MFNEKIYHKNKYFLSQIKENNDPILAKSAAHMSSLNHT